VRDLRELGEERVVGTWEIRDLVLLMLLELGLTVGEVRKQLTQVWSGGD
jgi:hypothetical protein